MFLPGPAATAGTEALSVEVISIYDITYTSVNNLSSLARLRVVVKITPVIRRVAYKTTKGSIAPATSLQCCSIVSKFGGILLKTN